MLPRRRAKGISGHTLYIYVVLLAGEVLEDDAEVSLVRCLDDSALLKCLASDYLLTRCVSRAGGRAAILETEKGGERGGEG